MFDNANVVLGSGVELACGSDGNVWISLGDERVTLPYPGNGLGGGELVVAPDERYAVLWMYSGQSEVAYELFALVPALRHLGGVPYMNGEGVAPAFSRDGRWLVMLVGITPRVHGTGEWAEEVLDPDAEGQIDVDVAELVVQDVGRAGTGAPPVRATVHARIPASFDPDEWADWTFDEPPRFTGDARVAFPMPWGGDVEVDLPPAGSIRGPDVAA